MIEMYARIRHLRLHPILLLAMVARALLKDSFIFVDKLGSIFEKELTNVFITVSNAFIVSALFSEVQFSV